MSFYKKVIIVLMLFAGSASFMPDAINSIALYVAIPLAFILSFIEKPCIPSNFSYISFLALFIWMFFSIAWARDTAVAFRQLRQLLGSVLVMTIVQNTIQEKKIIPWLYSIWLCLYLGAWYYARTHIISDIVVGQERLTDDKLNANMMAYFTFYISFSLFIIGEIASKQLIKSVFRVLFLGMIGVSFFVAIITASRQVLVIQIPLITFLIYERYIRKASKLGRLGFIIVASLLLLLTAKPIREIYSGSLLQQRNEISLNEDSRTLLLKDAYRVGMEHFPWGVGAGNYFLYSYNSHFSHNTFLELFANAGIIALLIYTIMILQYCFKQIRYYRSTQDHMFLVFLIFGIVFIVDNFFYVFYVYQWLIAYFILVSCHSEHYYHWKYHFS